MNIGNYLHTEPVDYHVNRKDEVGDETVDSNSSLSLDALLSQRTGITKIKLEVLAAQLSERLSIRQRNLGSIGYDELLIGNWLLELNSMGATNTHQSFQTRMPLHNKALDMSKDRRQTDVDCWRDIARLSHEFLSTWDAHEQAKARGKFLSETNSRDD